MEETRARRNTVPVLAVTAAAAVVLITLIGEFQADMELAQVNLTIRSIRSGLQNAIGEYLMRGEDNRLTELVETNPVRFLGWVPEGYRGETALPGASGTWRYDPAARILEYRPRHPGAFGGREEMHWQLSAVARVGGRPAGLRLDPVAN